MTEAQVADIVRQVTEGVSDKLSDTVLSYMKHMQAVQERNEKALVVLSNRLDRLSRQMHVIDRKTDGETEAALPWQRLKERNRRLQAEEAYQFLRDHRHDGPKVCNESNAAKQTFHELPRGYKDADALRKYCYSVHMLDYV